MNKILSFISKSNLETKEFGEYFSKYLIAGDILLLNGDLGAGKSELTRGIAKGLNINCPIPSPSFTILMTYDEGLLPLYHFDWYRLSCEEELFEISADDYLYGSGISIVEWPTQVSNYITMPCMHINIEKLEDDNSRKISIYTDNGFRNIDLEKGFNK